jgi:hypothetical protein
VVETLVKMVNLAVIIGGELAKGAKQDAARGNGKIE